MIMASLLFRGRTNWPFCTSQLQSISLLLFSLLFSVPYAQTSSLPPRPQHQVYIVYLGHHGDVHQDITAARHHLLLTSVKGSVQAAMESMLYSYKHSFSGFSARLTAEEASILSKLPEVNSVFLSQERKLHTTRSWEFLGMDDAMSKATAKNDSSEISLREQAKYGKGTVIGMLDSGIWPESESFKDDGMDPIPASWKGVCEAGDSFNSSNCNRKLIGARMYIKAYEERFGKLNVKATGEFRSVRDKDGHGTHTASTAAGREVRGAAAMGGFGRGTASGGAAHARLAIYKVCWPLPGEDPTGENTCGDADMLAAFDDAVADDVDVLSVSIGYGGGLQPPFHSDAIAIGALHAVRYGVTVVCSGGNDGPAPATVANLAPWILTVAASSVDRTFFAPVMLGDGTTIQGETVTPYSLEPRFYPLILASNALVANTSFDVDASQCTTGSLDPMKVIGRIVLCFRGVSARVAKGEEVLRAGGVGMILANRPQNGEEIVVDAHVLPATAVPAHVAKQILEYLKVSKNPMARLTYPTTNLGVKPSPFIAAFSSRGPNSVTPEILKPDIAAPGLNILAAWSGDNSPSKLTSDNRRVKYNIFSGTSMACPHVSGTVALLKALHPSWSPAAIKSALMTTALVMNSEGKPIKAATGEVASPFLMGAGEMNPTMAADPGLVYDVGLGDYAHFLCATGYNASMVRRMVGIKEFSCKGGLAHGYGNLNLPSITLQATQGSTSMVLHRKVTRVDNINGTNTYTVAVQPPSGVTIHVSPQKLVFIQAGQHRIFKITLSIHHAELSSDAFGFFTWSDKHGHKVTSPIIFLT